MPLTRNQKATVIREGSSSLEKASIVILTGFHGIDVETDTEFRRQIRDSGAKYRVIKNTLARRVLSDATHAPLYPFMKGETGFVFGGKDPVATCKVLSEFVKKHRDHLTLKSAYFEGRVISAQDVAALATIPPREVLLAQLAGVLQAPIQKLASVLQAPIVKLAGTLKALAEKRGEGGEA